MPFFQQTLQRIASFLQQKTSFLQQKALFREISESLSLLFPRKQEVRINFKVRSIYPLFFSIIFIIFIAVIVSTIRKTGYHFTYSATKSMPRGFYLVSPIKTSGIKRYDIVEFVPPAKIRKFIIKLHWIPKSGLMIKYVFGMPNDEVCINDNIVLINGNNVGKVHRFYKPGKLLPRSKICGKLKSDQYFVLTRNERSFDGRYFGTISLDSIIGIATPVLLIDGV